MTQKELINQLKLLKEIKPRKEWAVLLKSTLLENKVPSRMTGTISAQKASILETLSFIFAPKKLAYSLAVVMFLIVGVFGFARYTVPGDLLFPVKKIAENSQAALTGQTALRQEVANFNNRINDLAQVAKAGRVNNIPSAISEVNSNASALAKNLRDNPTENSQALKEIAISLKTLASVPGADLSENPDVKSLYQTVVESQIADLQKTTLTEEQSKALIEVQNLYGQGKYMEALEGILLINK